MTRASPQKGPKGKGVTALVRLYEADQTAWLEQTAELIDQGRYDELDYRHLGEMLRARAKEDRQEVADSLTILMMHLLHWDQQPRRRSRKWKSAILGQRYDLQNLLESQTLRRYAEEILKKEYKRAVKQAAAQAGMGRVPFPSSCPYTLDELLADR